MRTGVRYSLQAAPLYCLIINHIVMSKSTITFEMLFKMLHELNRECLSGKHYHIMLDGTSFYLCVNDETIYRSHDVVDFFGRMFVELCCVLYPRKPGIFDWMR